MKTRKMKRLATIAAIAMIASCMAAPMTTAWAAKTDVGKGNTITVVDDGYTHESLAAYQIFEGSYENSQLTVTDWGDGINAEAFIAALKADATFDYEEEVEGGDPVTKNLFDDVTYDSTNTGKSAQDVAKIIANFVNDTSPLEEEIFAKIAVANKSAQTSGEVSGSEISQLPDGYYVIVDNKAAGDGNGTAWSLGMLKVAGNTGATIEVTTKLDYPELEKKIKENVKSADESATYEDEDELQWNDVADYSIGDAVPFRLYAAMPSNIEDYQHYYIKFTDKLDAAFTLVPNFTISVKTTVGGVTTTTEVENNVFNIHKDVPGEDDTTFEITIEDVYALEKVGGGSITINETSVIIVDYSAILNESADIGLEGQENTAKLEYSNNPNVLYAPKTDGPTDEEKDEENPDKPNDEYTEEDTTPDNPDVPDGPDAGTDVDQDNTGDTPWDTVIAFTYELDVTKVDGVSGEKLEGAEFVLKNATGNGTGVKYAMVNADGKFMGWSDTKIDTPTEKTINGKKVTVTTKLTSAATTGLFTVSGLDDGTYYLEETKQPTGYNLLEGDTKLVITGNTVHVQDWDGTPAKALVEFVNPETDDTNDYDVVKLVVNDDDDKAAYSTDDTYAVATEVQNFMGLQLPGTGGIGTTIFYVVGGTMAAGAGVYLISKKRMKKDEE